MVTFGGRNPSNLVDLRPSVAGCLPIAARLASVVKILIGVCHNFDRLDRSGSDTGKIMANFEQSIAQMWAMLNRNAYADELTTEMREARETPNNVQDHVWPCLCIPTLSAIAHSLLYYELTLAARLMSQGRRLSQGCIACIAWRQLQARAVWWASALNTSAKKECSRPLKSMLRCMIASLPHSSRHWWRVPTGHQSHGHPPTHPAPPSDTSRDRLPLQSSSEHVQSRRNTGRRCSLAT